LLDKNVSIMLILSELTDFMSLVRLFVLVKQLLLIFEVSANSVVAIEL
jgi:hypothetical protein